MRFPIRAHRVANEGGQIGAGAIAVAGVTLHGVVDFAGEQFMPLVRPEFALRQTPAAFHGRHTLSRPVEGARRTSHAIARWFNIQTKPVQCPHHKTASGQFMLE